jgi:hypothetical protein
MLSWKVGHSLDLQISTLSKWVFRRPIHPNFLTFGGLILNLFAGILLAV